MGGLVKNVLNGTKPGMGDGLLVLANGLVLELNGGLVVMICVLVAGWLPRSESCGLVWVMFASMVLLSGESNLENWLWFQFNSTKLGIHLSPAGVVSLPGPWRASKVLSNLSTKVALGSHFPLNSCQIFGYSFFSLLMAIKAVAACFSLQRAQFVCRASGRIPRTHQTNNENTFLCSKVKPILNRLRLRLEFDASTLQLPAQLHRMASLNFKKLYLA